MEATRQNGQNREDPVMLSDWHALSAETQEAVTRAAFRHALEKLAGQAESLAQEMEAGALADRGGPDALRLLAALVRAGEPETGGHA